MSWTPPVCLLGTALLSCAPLSMLVAQQTRSGLVAGVPTVDELVEELRQLAADVRFVDSDDLLFGRHDGMFRHRPQTAEWREAADCAVRLRHLPERLLPLLEDEDPRLRLFAAYGLYRSVDPRWLQHLAALADDAGSVRTTLPIATAYLPGAGTPKLPVQDTEVGVIVRGFLQMWEAPEPGTDEFATWRQRQVELAPTGAALRLRMKLATGGVTGGSHAPVGPLLEVFNVCRGAAPGLREIAPVALLHDRYPALAGSFADIEAALLFAVRRLGRDNVLRLLRREAPVIDGEPLPPEHYAGFEDGFARFVLERPATVGLLAEDARALLEIGRSGGELRWFRGAARLRPQRATSILREALHRVRHQMQVHERTQCANLLWDLQPDANADYVVEWFYTPEEGPLGWTPGRHAEFATHLLKRYGAADRAMFARLVRDPRFEQVGPRGLMTILRVLNMTTMDAVVSEQELGGLWHPWGVDRAFLDSKPFAGTEMEGDDHAALTRKLHATLDAWRAAIRDHIADWGGND